MATEPAGERDGKAEARAAQQRDRLKAQREEAILAGLDEVDRWIEDSLARGLAVFMGEAAHRCRTLAQRLVDAKAPALATSVDTLPHSIMALPEAQRSNALVEALGEYHLLAEAYRRQEKLPEALRHDVRRLVGWSLERQALLDDATMRRISTEWTVIAVRVEIQPDKLRRSETWLVGDMNGTAVPAVLIDYVPVAAASSGTVFDVGEVFAGELVFYPSAVPLRAVMVTRKAVDGARVLPALRLSEALADYNSQRATQPWLKQVPITISGVQCKRADASGLWLVDDDVAVPVAPQLHDQVVVLAAVELQTVAGLWDGRYFVPGLAETSIGRWTK